MPPLERPMACVAVPLLRLVRGGRPRRWWHPPWRRRGLSGSSRGGIEKPLENVGLPPRSAIPLEDGVPAAEERWQVAPGVLSGSRNPQYHLDKPAVIRAPLRPGPTTFPGNAATVLAHWASVSTNRSIASLKHGILIEKSQISTDPTYSDRIDVKLCNSFQMALLCPGLLLVAAAPARPGARGLGVRRPSPNQMPEQAAYFGHGERRQVGFEIDRTF